jgi:hypothetical protein
MLMIENVVGSGMARVTRDVPSETTSKVSEKAPMSTKATQQPMQPHDMTCSHESMLIAPGRL